MEQPQKLESLVGESRELLIGWGKTMERRPALEPIYNTVPSFYVFNIERLKQHSPLIQREQVQVS